MVQFFGASGAEAKPYVKKYGTLIAQQSKQHYVSPAALHTHLPAENVHIHVGSTLVKTREERFQLFALAGKELQALTAQPAVVPARSFKDAPEPVPVSRLLLFPQHYFW